MIRYEDITGEQQQIVDYIVQASGFMDYEGFAGAKLNKGQELLDYVHQFETFEQFALDNDIEQC